MERSETIQEIATALSQLQAEVQNPKRVATNPFFKSKYAPLSEVWNSCRESLGKYGLSLLQEPTTSFGENANRVKVSISTLVTHKSGEWIQFNPLELYPQKADPQSIGAVITYGCRYALSSVLGLPSEDDIDGNTREQHTTTFQKRHEPPAPKVSPSLLTRLQTVTAEKVSQGILPPEKNQSAVDMCTTGIYHGKHGDEPLTDALLTQFITKLEKLQPKPEPEKAEPSADFIPDPAVQLSPEAQQHAWDVEQHGSDILKAAMQDAVAAGDETQIEDIYQKHQTRLAQA